MAVFRPIDKGDSENTPKPIFYSKHEENKYYYNMVNPQNGLRYDIPMLTPTDPDYFSKYVYFMKMKEQSEETFDKILRWD
ncbi:hypothetical protein [Ghiorsea bivora]|uniref:hypothetical protein n=1 Tax=Ghiorsea bivora TaxID=1485545 RepID=UPI000571C900|nr:hypothetical protein [Ghiorsea bivora]